MRDVALQFMDSQLLRQSQRNESCDRGALGKLYDESKGCFKSRLELRESLVDHAHDRRPPLEPCKRTVSWKPTSRVSADTVGRVDL